jgi:U3 small nucleolar RNA-associated protein 10
VQAIFEEVYEPLVDQLENDLGGQAEYESRMDRVVVPAIAQLALAVHDDAMWKKLNNRLLLKTRHHETKVSDWEILKKKAF